MAESVRIIKETILPFGFIKLRSDGILHTHFDIKMEISIDQSKQVYEAAYALTNGKAYPNLFTASKFMIPDKETRDFMITEKRLALTCADAFIVDSLAQRIMGNMYIKINKPPVPSQLFLNQEDAIKWLRTFIKKKVPPPRAGLSPSM